ncbi:uncharacterized protein PAC_09422 [Phialocephala subalpina]|uniref:Zn(2)-C6 fungal-type domain-containing protein n=1 Tax=Phialocephala subalpina TaxID=576137 RepID=A0A1L7X3C9_9HELO|nr:uncharacterized protein PAC_09422 [Phialocephala subalpina]
MVGVKSLGCAECKRRKVKCDQRFPTCVKCERLGFACSGPKSHFIRFVRPGGEEHINSITRSQCAKLKSPASTTSERLAAELVQCLRSIENVGFQCRCLGLFMTFLPSRIGYNSALDAAVRCLVQAHQYLLCQGKKTVVECLDDYNEAVALIRKDLNHGQAQTSSETVCAALILPSYEIYRNDQCRAWMTHAGGVAAILECWGPDHITSDFEMAIFVPHYSSILDLRKRSLEIFTELDRYVVDCLTSMATLPTLLHDIKEAKTDPEMRDTSTTLLARAQEFKTKLAQHATNLHLDFMNPAIVRECHSDSNHTVLEFYHPEVGFRFNFYWAMTIVANKLLLELGERDSSLVQEYEDAAEDICRSLEYLTSMKPRGSLWLTVTASMAFGVSGEENRHRIVEAMNGVYDPYDLIQIKDHSLVLEQTFYLLTGGVSQVGER